MVRGFATIKHHPLRLSTRDVCLDLIELQTSAKMGSLPTQKGKYVDHSSQSDMNRAHHILLAPTPVFLFAHGSTMMLGEESEPAKIWEGIGNEALRRGVKRIVMMVRLNLSPYRCLQIWV